MWLLFLLGIYFLIILLMKSIGIFINSTCPKCNCSVSRIPRKISDRILAIIFLFVILFKRYECNSCNWMGLRWKK